MFKKILVVLFVFLNISACSDISETSKPALKLVVSVENPQYIENARSVLRNRFNENRENLFSSTEVRVNGDVIEVLISGGAPSEGKIEKLVKTKGDFKISAESGLTLVEGNSVKEALAAIINEQVSIMISLNEQGAKKMHSWTTENVGKVVVAKFDGKTLSVAKIREPFGKRFQFSVNSSKKEAREIAMFLRSGTLLTNIDIVDNRM